MQILAKYIFGVPWRLQIFAGLFAAFLSMHGTAIAQQPSKDSVYTYTDSTNQTPSTALNDTSDIITTFQQFNLPPELLAHFGQITPEDAVTLHEEFQVTQNDEDGIATLITVKLHFFDDHLVGYIIEAPIDKTIQVTVSDFTVNIPIEWICTPATAEHQQHYVGSLSAIKIAEAQYKCSGWHIKLPEPPHVEAPQKKSKKEKSTNKTGNNPPKKKHGQ